MDRDGGKLPGVSKQLEVAVKEPLTAGTPACSAAGSTSLTTGDRLEKLARQHQDGLFRYALRMLGNSTEAEEVVQQSFVRAFQALSRDGEVRNDSAWLYRIVRNGCIDRVRRQARAPISLDEDHMAAPPARAPLPLDEIEREELYRLIQEHVRELPSPLRDAVILFYFEHRPYEEIADILDVPLGTLKTYLSRARKLLRHRLKELCDVREETGL